VFVRNNRKEGPMRTPCMPCGRTTVDASPGLRWPGSQREGAPQPVAVKTRVAPTARGGEGVRSRAKNWFGDPWRVWPLVGGAGGDGVGVAVWAGGLLLLCVEDRKVLTGVIVVVCGSVPVLDARREL